MQISALTAVLSLQPWCNVLVTFLNDALKTVGGLSFSIISKFCVVLLLFSIAGKNATVQLAECGSDYTFLINNLVNI